MDRHTSNLPGDRRYPVLRLCAGVSSLFGTLLMAAGVLLLVSGLAAVLAMMGGGPPGRPGPLAGFGGLAVLVWSTGLLGGGLQFVGLGALIRLMIHLEENTRASARSLGRLVETRPGDDIGAGRPSFTS
ncbi:hypothetical protein [Tautonia plasticadhaerens]|uniref:Uncharacterized protein n=1 Tax=Tautonia plasticadhaerens TaxID=2527974 RepID=A0A518HDP9_9BACT|nr:hypothetical protein [Tautonia plasticadhaerens]QDV38979.1 hypothetical protein ElP_69400 [Tautonia plasticadhaerens]